VLDVLPDPFVGFSAGEYPGRKNGFSRPSAEATYCFSVVGGMPVHDEIDGPGRVVQQPPMGTMTSAWDWVADVRLRAVGQGQAASAFGVDPATVWRWDKTLASDGVAGLVPNRRPAEAVTAAGDRTEPRAGRSSGRVARRWRSGRPAHGRRIPPR
jgi:hypothetical protein